MYKYLLLLVVFSSMASADVVENMHKLGEGEMNFLFWRLYRAELFSVDAGLTAAVKQDETAYLSMN